MASRRQPARRRTAGREQHADPVAEVLLDDTNLEEQLSRKLAAAGKKSPLPAGGGGHGGSVGSGPQGTGAAVPSADSSDSDAEEVAAAAGESAAIKARSVAALNAALAKEAEEAARFINEAEAVFAKGGDAAVQDQLRGEIARTKKLESELSQMKRKADGAKKQQETKQTELAKLAQQKDVIHAACKQLIAERDRLEGFCRETADADAQRREDVRTKFEKDVDGILAKVNDQAGQKATTLEENVALQKEFDELKASFDAMMEGKMGEWKDRDEQTRTVVTKLQEHMAVHERLSKLCQARETDADSLERGAKAYTEQAELYSARMGDFEGALAKSAEVVELTAKREQQTKDDIAALEAARANDVKQRKLADEETQKAKARIRELRKHMTQLERTKAAAEKKVRNAQEILRKRKAAAASVKA